MIKKVTSSSNSYIKQIIKLRKDKNFRNSQKKILIIGKNTLNDLKKTHNIDTLIVTDESFIKNYKAKNILLVTEKVMKKITNVKSPDKIAAVIDISNKEIKNKDFVLILDNISDPKNLGAIIRCALAFNFDLVICTKNSVDPFNDKALRAAKGATLSIPILILSEEGIKSFIQKNKINVYLADIKGENISKISFKKPFTIIVSNEAKGPSSWAKKLSTKTITIPLKKSINSLNVSVAAGICMYLAGEKNA